jgi:mono/diheme cytochrome c family protein
MARRILWLIGVTALVLAACGGDPHPDVTMDRDAASVAAGEAIFAESCAVCHGEGMEGGTGPALVDAELGHPDSDFIVFVTDGKGSEMPAFGDTLSSEEIASVVDYVRSVQAANLDE